MSFPIKKYGLKVGFAVFFFGVTYAITNITMAFVTAALCFLVPYFWQESRALFRDVKKYKQTTEFVASLSSLIRSYHTLDKAMEKVNPEKYSVIKDTLTEIKQRIAVSHLPSLVFMNAGRETENRYLIEIGQLFRILERQNSKKEFIIERLEALRIAFQNENIDMERRAKSKKSLLNNSFTLNIIIVYLVVLIMPRLIKDPFQFYFKTGVGQILCLVGVFAILLPHLYVFFVMKGREG